jgi:predicted GNAT family N-acyltransferase
MEFVVSNVLSADARAIREEVFMREQGYVDEFDAIDARAFHLVLYVDGAAAGCGRFFAGDAPGEWILGRVAVRAPLRRRGLAGRIVREAVSRMKELGAASIHLGAQQYATGLYEKCGFVPCGPVYLDEGNPHVPMCLRLPHSGK